MVQILLGTGLIIAGVVIALVAGGVSGGPQARRARLAALGKWPAIAVTGAMFGLPFGGFFVIVLWFQNQSDLTLDMILIGISLAGGMVFGRMMVGLLGVQTQIDAEIASLGLPRQNEKKVAQRPADGHAGSIPDTAQGIEARRILDERRGALRRSRIIGGGGAVLLVAVGVLLALMSGARLVGGASGLLAVAYFHYRVITSWFRARPRSLLLLRRFTGFTDRSFVVAREIGEACSGLAVALTVQDESFRGDVPIALDALLSYVGIPVAFIVPFLLFAVAPHAFFELGLIPVVASAVVLAGGLYWLFRAFLRRRAVMRAGLANYQPMLKRFFRRVRAGRVMYSGTRVMRFSHDAWRNAIELCFDEVDCVVIDITNMSENVAWEVGTVYRRLPPEAVLLIWEYEPGQPADSIPAALLDRLLVAVPQEKIERSRRLARPNENASVVEAALMMAIWPAEIAQCLAAGARRQPAPTAQSA